MPGSVPDRAPAATQTIDVLASLGCKKIIADSLANVHDYDARDFGFDSHEKALLLGLDVLRNYN